jgi:hypothetical protein
LVILTGRGNRITHLFLLSSENQAQMEAKLNLHFLHGPYEGGSLKHFLRPSPRRVKILPRPIRKIKAY